MENPHTFRKVFLTKIGLVRIQVLRVFQAGFSFCKMYSVAPFSALASAEFNTLMHNLEAMSW